jgi:hypothetical protein
MPETTGKAIFPPTDWSLIEAAASSPVAASILICSYLPPIRSYLCNIKRFSTSEADEILQGFIASKFIERHLIEAADEGRGRFRTLVLSSLNRYLIDLYRRREVEERHVSAMSIQNDINHVTDADCFDIEWARIILNTAIEVTRTELESSERQPLWQLFITRVLDPILNDQPVPEYDKVCAAFGFGTATQACSAIVTVKRMFARNLRRVIAGYESDTEAIEEELNDLKNILASRRARSSLQLRIEHRNE